MHTPLCGHAFGMPTEYVQCAAARRIDLITFTCHVPVEDPAFGGQRIRMREDQLEEYFTLVEEGRQLGAQLGVEVLTGIEAEIFPERERLDGMYRVLESWPFDFVLGSLHHPLPSYRAWLEAHELREDRAIIDAYFTHLADALPGSPYHSLSHPDVIRCYGTVSSFYPDEHEPSIRRLLQAAVANDTCLEVNTSGLVKEAYEVHPDPVILRWAHEEGVKLTLGSDSHRPEQVGQHFDEVLALLRDIGFDAIHAHRKGERFAVPLDPS